MGKKYRVELTTLAQQQIIQIASYITNELQAPYAATRLVNKLEAEIAKLDTMPERIILIDEEPWRSKGVHKYIIDEHIVYFIVLEPDYRVRVIAVVMGRMNQKKQLDMTGV